MPQLNNGPQQQTFLALEARKSFQLGLWFKTRDRDRRRERVDLTDATLTFTAAQLDRKGGAVVITQPLDIELPALGHATLELQAADLDLDDGEYPFALTMVTAEGYSAVVLKGFLQITANADPTVPGDFDGSNPPSNMTLEFASNNIVSVVIDNLPTTDLQIGTVAVAESPADVGASIRGAYPLQFLDLTMPRGGYGPEGPQGEQGPVGPEGEQGPEGIQGPAGPRGVAGPRGTQGLKGDTGATGAAGGQGAPGMPGAAGAPGAPGARGPKGDKGDTGAVGPAGPGGPKGDIGDTGPAGATEGLFRGEWEGGSVGPLEEVVYDFSDVEGSWNAPFNGGNRVTVDNYTDYLFTDIPVEERPEKIVRLRGEGNPDSLTVLTLDLTDPEADAVTEVSWYQAVSCEGFYYDFVVAKRDGVIIEEDYRMSGVLGWTKFTMPIDPGTNTVTWEFSKDGSGEEGWDSGFIARVSLMKPGVDPDPQPGPHYFENDIVLHNGEMFISEVDGPTATPGTDSAQWLKIPVAGPPGAQGAQGPEGLQGPEGPEGPQGPEGPAGATGATGADGVAGLTPELRGTANIARTINTGSSTFPLTPSMAAPFPVGATVKASRTSNPAQYMLGAVTASSTSSVTIAVTEVAGSGTISDWTLTLSGYRGPQGIQGTQGVKGDTGNTGNTGAPGTPGAKGDPGSTLVPVTIINPEVSTPWEIIELAEGQWLRGTSEEPDVDIVLPQGSLVGGDAYLVYFEMVNFSGGPQNISFMDVSSAGFRGVPFGPIPAGKKALYTLMWASNRWVQYNAILDM